MKITLNGYWLYILTEYLTLIRGKRTRRPVCINLTASVSFQIHIYSYIIHINNTNNFAHICNKPYDFTLYVMYRRFVNSMTRLFGAIVAKRDIQNNPSHIISWPSG